MSSNKTIYGIAEALKINASTVSRALRGDPRVNENTREKICNYAESIGYRPNLQARNLASGRTNTFWLLVSDIFRQPEQQLAQHLHECVELDDYDLMILTYHNDPVVLRRLLSRLDQNAADGAFIISSGDDLEIKEEFASAAKSKCPLVFLDQIPEEIQVPGVTTDNRLAVRDLCKRSLDCGVDFVIAGFEQNSPSEIERRRELLKTLGGAGIEHILSEDIDKLNIEEMKNRHVAYITSSENEVGNFVTKYYARFPNKCNLTVGVFDQWSIDRQHIDNIIVCKQNHLYMAELAYQKMLRILENSKDENSAGTTKVRPEKYNYVKYTTIKERSHGTMTMRWTMALIYGGLLILSLVAWLLTPAAKLDGKIPLSWVTDANPQRDDQVKKFNEMYPNLHLYIDPNNSGAMKVVTQSSAGMGGDIVGHVSPLMALQTYTEAGILWDVTKQAKAMGFGPETLPKHLRKFLMVKELDKNGEIVERQYVYPCNVAHTYIIYNKNIFDKYKIPYPKGDITWDEFLTMCKKLTVYKNEDDKYPEKFGTTGTNMELLIWQNGGKVMNKGGTKSILSSKETLDALELYHNIFFKYRIQPTKRQQAGMQAQGGWGGNMSFFGAGEIATIWGARWMLIQFRRFISEQKKARAKFLKNNPGKEDEAPEVLRLGACLVPRFKGKPRVTTVNFRGAGINAGSKNREEGLKFLKYLASKQYSDILNSGADSKPGNKKYNTIDQFINPEFPGEKEVHEMSIKSIPYGYMRPITPFISASKIALIIKKLKEKIEADEDMDRDDLREACDRAEDEINREIVRNIKRVPKIKKYYDKLLEQGAEPIKYHEEVSK